MRLSLSTKLQQKTHTVPGTGAGMGAGVCAKSGMLKVIPRYGSPRDEIRIGR